MCTCTFVHHTFLFWYIKKISTSKEHFAHMQISDKAGFGRSLFERLVILGHQKHLLNVQYRMHPSISLFPNTEFYDKQILDSPSVKERCYEKCFLLGDMFQTYSFLNVAGQDELDERGSHKNMVEVAVVSNIVLNLFKGITRYHRRIKLNINLSKRFILRYFIYIF